MPPALKPFSRRQMEVITSPNDRGIILAEGSVRSGKSVACNVKWLSYIQAVPPGAKLLMSGRTQASLKNNVLDNLLPLVGSKNYHWTNRQAGELNILGRLIRCVGASDETSHEVIQGDTYAGWYGDEVVLYPKSFIDQGRARCSDEPGLILWNCNPEGPYHPVYTEFVVDSAPAVKAGLVRRFHFTLDDNLALSEGYKASLMAGYTGLFFERYILGRWVLAEGVVYDGWSLERYGFDDHDAPEKFDAIHLVGDYGTQNPMAAYRIGVRGDESWVLDEYWHDGRAAQRQKADAEYEADLAEFVGHDRETPTVLDPSAASLFAALNAAGWTNLYPAKNAVVPGIRTVANRLAAGKIRVHRRNCPNLVREFGTYSWDPKAAARGEDAPLKRNDHGVDALRYHEHTLYGAEPEIAQQAVLEYHDPVEISPY